jgi:L-threonylcarbamoyladenylate synthase
MRSYVTLLQLGGVVACPTETQMGLLADVRNAAAVERVCQMKRRPPADPLPLIAPSPELAFALAREVSREARALAAAHWPGPLTLVLLAREGLPPATTRDGKVAVRVPGPSPALELVTAFGAALTATSANLSGQPPLASAADLRAAFGQQLAGIVPGTPPGGPASTIVDVSGDVVRVLRQGPIVLDRGSA